MLPQTLRNCRTANSNAQAPRRDAFRQGDNEHAHIWRVPPPRRERTRAHMGGCREQYGVIPDWSPSDKPPATAAVARTLRLWADAGYEGPATPAQVPRSHFERAPARKRTGNARPRSAAGPGSTSDGQRCRRLSSPAPIRNQRRPTITEAVIFRHRRRGPARLIIPSHPHPCSCSLTTTTPIAPHRCRSTLRRSPLLRTSYPLQSQYPIQLYT